MHTDVKVFRVNGLEKSKENSHSFPCTYSLERNVHMVVMLLRLSGMQSVPSRQTLIGQEGPSENFLWGLKLFK